jgi:catechol 2,3-dioxygenase-like lactoylglutathione lyase family enzyme
MIRVLKINHVAMHVDDINETAAFYTGLLGLAPIRPPMDEDQRKGFQSWQATVGTPRPDGGMWVGVPGGELHLIKADQVAGATNPFGPHIALEVEDFDEAKRTLDERGIQYLEGPDGLPFRQLWMADPNRNTIELWQRR